MMLSREFNNRLFAVCLGDDPGSTLTANSNVRVADLATLGDTQLNELRDSEFEALRADVAYERARNEYSLFRARIRKAEQRENVARFEEDAAALELKITAREDAFATRSKPVPALVGMHELPRSKTPTRRDAALGRVEIARLEAQRASIYLALRQRLGDAAGDFVEVARAQREIAFLNRDIDRIEALRRARTPNAERFDLRKLRRTLAKEQSRLARYRQRHARSTERAEQERAKYAAIEDRLRDLAC